MALTINDFALLLLATLANNDKKDTNEPKTLVARLPFDYRQRIENILCANNGWKKEFSCLIDVDAYFKDHFYWEEWLSIELINVAKQYNMEIQYDLIYEQISFRFKTSEVEKIISSFEDKNLIKKMIHFSSLLVDRIYSRRHQEEFTDYTARTREMMNKNL